MGKIPLSSIHEQRMAVSRSVRDIEKEMTRTNDEDLYNELLAQKNGLTDAYETLGQIEKLVGILRYLGV